MRFLCSVLVFFMSFALEAKLEDHFKKIENKSDLHKIRGIDFIYLINLDARPEKLEKTMEQLIPYEIYPYRFSAVNGWDLSIEDMQDIGLKYTEGMKKNFKGVSYLTQDRKPTSCVLKPDGKGYFRRKMSFGMVGCLLSHLSILQDAYDSGYQTIWVLEDDIVVLKDPRQIPQLIEDLDQAVGKEGWDILFTDRDFRNSKGEYERCLGWSPRPNFKPSNPKRFEEAYLINEKFRKIGARFGTHSMILRRSGIKKVLEFIKTYQPFNPYDLDMYLPEGIRLYTVVKDIVGNQPSTLSDTSRAISE